MYSSEYSSVYESVYELAYLSAYVLVSESAYLLGCWSVSA